MTNNWPRLRIIAILNKGMASIIEQGLFSGISFITSLLLGRWLIPEDYGAYSVAMSIFLLLAGLYTSLILEPLKYIWTSNINRKQKKILWLGTTFPYNYFMHLINRRSYLLVFLEFRGRVHCKNYVSKSPIYFIILVDPMEAL